METYHLNLPENQNISSPHNVDKSFPDHSFLVDDKIKPEI